jgi:hypothetical protein
LAKQIHPKGEKDMKVQVVRNGEGQVVCAVPVNPIGPNHVLIEPELEDGEQIEEVEVSMSAFLNTQELFKTYSS